MLRLRGTSVFCNGERLDFDTPEEAEEAYEDMQAGGPDLVDLFLGHEEDTDPDCDEEGKVILFKDWHFRPERMVTSGKALSRAGIVAVNEAMQNGLSFSEALGTLDPDFWVEVQADAD